MRRPLLTWIWIGVLLLSIFQWGLGDWKTACQRVISELPLSKPPLFAGTASLRSVIPSVEAGPAPPRLRRLANTTRGLRDLIRDPKVILLENALLDTTLPASLPIPAELRHQGDPKAYIVQARCSVNDAFRAQLNGVGATLVSYIPNNACLVRASAEEAGRLEAAPQIQAVLPYEPYYKLRPSVLGAAVDGTPLPEGSALSLLLFPGGEADARADLGRMGVGIVGGEASPFGPVLRVAPPPGGPPSALALLVALARLTEVQGIERGSTASAGQRSQPGCCRGRYRHPDGLKLHGPGWKKRDGRRG